MILSPHLEIRPREARQGLGASRLMGRAVLGWVLVVIALLAPAGWATAISGWTPLYKGIDYATATNSASETPGPLNIYVLRISLHTPGVSMTTTPSATATYPGFETFSQTTGDFVNAVGAKVGINANFFSVVSTTAQPQNLFGAAVSRGTVVSLPESSYPAMLLAQNNTATMTTTAPDYDLSTVWNAVAGSSIILDGGVAVTPPAGTAGDPFNPNPRSAIGLSQDGSYLYLMVIDGRTTVSVGCTQAQAGTILALFGAYQGINLDGGGSSALVRQIAPGVVTPFNAPSGGPQRLDGNNLAIFADALPVAPVAVLPYTPLVQANGPVAWYRFNETTGTTAVDSSGNGLSGSYPASGVTKGVADQPIKSESGTAATYSGAANAHVTVPYNSGLNPGSFTVEAWVKPTSASNAAFQGLVSNRDDKGSGAAGNAGYILYLGPATGDGGTARWQFWTGGTTAATYTALGRNTATGFGLGPAATANVWTHVAGTFAATSGPDGTGRYTGTQTLYVNGQQAVTLAGVKYLPNPNKVIYIGAGNNELGTSDNLRFTGGIDEVAIYNSALTTAQILAHYNSGNTTLAAPSIALASPANGASFPLNTTINLVANAGDTDGSVVKVEFFDGATKLGEATSAPFAYAWTGAAAGGHEISLRATDDSTLVTTSAVASISVIAPNVAPTVAVTAPTANAVFQAPASFTITAVASDTDGTVTKVEFYNGATKLGESGTAPFMFAVTGAMAGSYTLTARATDNAGATTTSSVVPVSVSAMPLDSDGDGLPDDWELAHGLDPHLADDAALDADGDGLTNLQEFLAGTDPRNGADKPRVAAIAVQLDGSFILQVPTVTGRSYRVEANDAFPTGSWNVVTDHLAGTGAVEPVADSAAAASRSRIYRVTVLP